MVEIVDFIAGLEPITKAIVGLATIVSAIFAIFARRVRVTVRNFQLPVGDTSFMWIAFEAENVSGNVSSLEPGCELVGYSPERRKQVYKFNLSNDDRQLQPHAAKKISATHGDKQNRIIIFLWYLHFKIYLTKGGTINVRFRNIQFDQIGFWRFHFERLRFVWFGILPDEQKGAQKL